MIAAVGLSVAFLILAVVMWMLLTRRLREKYAVLWLVVGLVVFVLGLFPQLVVALTAALGVQIPANLLFAAALALLLGVGLHLSWELSQAEDENRRLAEEVAILRAESDDVAERLSRLEAQQDSGPEAPGQAHT